VSREKYLFGPVPSRRLGLSLGVDITPLKTCTQNCVYCQLGVHAAQRIERGVFVPTQAVLDEIRARLKAGLNADHITFSGSGEPTLHRDLGRMIRSVHEMTDIPVAVITNGTLLSDPAVRADCAQADVVLPSLDAGDEATFRRINQPHSSITFDGFVDGLCRFRREYRGPIWLEVFLIEPINTSDEQIEKIARLIERIGPDRVDLNTAVRPTTEPDVHMVDPDRMAQIAAALGPRAQVVVDFDRPAPSRSEAALLDRVLDVLQRRPCTAHDLAASLGAPYAEVLKALQRLEGQDRIERRARGSATYFQAR